MTKKEVALIKKVIDSFCDDLKNEEKDTIFAYDEETRIDLNARIDVLVWLLMETGHADGLDPELLPEYDPADES